MIDYFKKMDAILRRRHNIGRPVRIELYDFATLLKYAKLGYLLSLKQEEHKVEEKDGSLASE